VSELASEQSNTALSPSLRGDRVSSPLRIEDLQQALVAPGGPFAALEVVSSTGSTNADLMDAVSTGAADRTVLLAEEQTAGRGRRSREWVSPAESGLYLSVLLRPDGVPAARLGTLAVVAAVALLRTARDVAGVPAALKWPNDLLAGPSLGKCAGARVKWQGGQTDRDFALQNCYPP